MNASATECPACLGQDSEPYTVHDGLRLVRCRICGVIHMAPMPAPEAAAAIYDDAYDGATAGYFAKVEKKMRRSRHRVRRLRREIPGGRFLDVGCSGGFMVEAAREQGFEAYGVELDPVSVAYAAEHYPLNQYHRGTVQSFAGARGDADRGFDAVYCSEVIEHVPEVRPFVAAIAGLMKPGAVIYLTTPDIGHWRRPRDLTRWDGFCPPSHCLYFSPSSLQRLLAENGLDVYRRFFAWKPGIKILARKR